MQLPSDCHLPSHMACSRFWGRGPSSHWSPAPPCLESARNASVPVRPTLDPLLALQKIFASLIGDISPVLESTVLLDCSLFATAADQVSSLPSLKCMSSVP